EGEIQQLGSPRDVYIHPKNFFVEDFIGDRNIKKVAVLEKKQGSARVKLGNSVLDINCSNSIEGPCAPDETAILAIHMDKMRISCNERPNSLSGDVLSIHYAGSQIRTEINIDCEEITVIEYQNNSCDYSVGDKVYISWEESGAVLLPMEDYVEGNNVS
ncbi:MAG: TOBE domain-containing protein, partial [Clostridiales bacterium]|nr:TOBE domain-containing protein [Clostridiales bacterium]